MADKNLLIYGIPDEKLLADLGKNSSKVYIMEGRPDLFGAKILSKKLLDIGVNPILITDNTAGFCIYKRLIDEVALFYYKKDTDDLICRAGSLALAVVPKYNNAEVFAYPAKETMREASPIDELFYFEGMRIAPDGIKGYVPLIDNVPIRLVKKVY